MSRRSAAFRTLLSCVTNRVLVILAGTGVAILVLNGTAAATRSGDPGQASTASAEPRSMALRAGDLAERAAAWRAADAGAIRRAVPGLTAIAFAPAFDEMRGQVKTYADWVYGWVASLVTSLEIAQVGTQDVGLQILRTGGVDLTITQSAIVDYVDEKFTAMVVRPERSRQQIRLARARTLEWVIGMDHDLAGQRRMRIATAARNAGEPAGPLLERYGAPFVGFSSDLGSTPTISGDPIAQFPAPDDEADVILTRSLRPFAARAVSWLARFAIIPAAGAAAVAPGVEAGALAPTLAYTGGLIVLVWALDYSVNWTDAALNRDAVESDIHALIDRTARRARSAANHRILVFLCDASSEAVFCAEPPPVAAGTAVH